MSMLSNIYGQVRQTCAAYKSYQRQLQTNKERQVRFYNWWKEPYEQLWLYRFVKSRNIMPEDEVLNFISVFGKSEVADFIQDGPVVFFTGENLHNSDHLSYTNCLRDKKNVKLALGFDWVDEPKYMRFPLWIPYVFDPKLDDDSIRKRCEELRHPVIGHREKFASLVARYDWNGTRSEIYEAIQHIASIGCPSQVHHNDDELKTKYNDNKIAYLRQFAFNICPENSNSYGYVTEKVFEAIAAGCLPIYWGSYNKPEVDILNQEAIIKWNMNGDNSANIALIEDLYTHPDRLQEFMTQPRLKQEADEKVVSIVNQLEQKIKNLL